jgi:hypothetical protein
VALNNIGRGKGLARPGHPEQSLMHQAIFDTLHQCIDRLGLVPGGFEPGFELEFLGHSINSVNDRQPVLYRRRWLRLIPAKINRTG